MLGLNDDYAADKPEAKFWRLLVKKKAFHKKLFFA